MTERVLPLADGASACPFVAFEDDRDERATVPDHRHRCYAEPRPAPRALAHQEAYCLSSAFPVCPIFQDWARREAARARGDAPGSAAAATASGRDRSTERDDEDRGRSDIPDPDRPAGPEAAFAADAAAAAGGVAAAGAAGASAGPAKGGAGGPAGGAASAGDGVAGTAAAAWGGASADRESGERADTMRPDETGTSSRDVGSDADPAADPRGDAPIGRLREPEFDDDDDRAAASGGADSVRRNPPREWSAPPPWLPSSGERRRPDAPPPPFLDRRARPGRGLAGSSADRLAGGRPDGDDEDDGGVPWTASGSSAAAARAAAGGAALGGAALGGAAAEAGAPRAPAGPGEGGRRPTVPETREDGGGEDADEAPRRPARRPRAYDQHLGGPNGPDWERPRRYEAYPTIKTRVGLPNVPRLALLAGLVAVLAVGLYFLPGLLGVGSGTGSPAGATPRSSVAGQPAATASPTVAPAPTPAVYTIKRGDSLSKIAKANGITIEELLAANPTITDPNKISEGQQIILPVASQPPPDAIDGSAAPSG